MRGAALKRVAGVMAIALLWGANSGAIAGTADRTWDTHSADSPPPPPKPEHKHRKLSSTLAAVMRAHAAHGVRAAEQEAAAHGLRPRDAKIRVVVERASTDAQAVRAIAENAGGKVEAEYLDLLQLSLPVGALKALADHLGVRYVRPPFRPIADAVTSEGVVAANVAAWHSGGINGLGTRIAIIDLGFRNYNLRQPEDLPPSSVTPVDFCSGELNGVEATDHGTAVAEVVHDVAPRAELFLICIDSEVGLGLALDYVKERRIDIVNHSVSWLNTSRGDGSGGPATPDAIVAEARASGTVWVNSAGNFQRSHWSGSFADGNPNGWHEFTSADEGNSVFLPPGTTACAYLKWDQWPAATADYDLYLFRHADVAVVAGSQNLQDGAQRPTEALCYENSTLVPDWFFLAIHGFAPDPSVRMDLFVSGPTLEYQVPQGSVSEPASSPHALAVGAVCWNTDRIQTFSSVGPTISGLIKPDIAAADSVSTAAHGPSSGCESGFNGTSASAAHVSGAAALIRQAGLASSPAAIQALLEGRALDRGAAGKDNELGAGELWLGTPPSQVRQIALAANDIVYDSGTQRIYASVSGSAGPSGNSITSIDPLTGVVGVAVPIGSEPQKLAISDDGQYIYAGLDGTGSIRRFDIASATAGLEFSIEIDPFWGVHRAEDIEVVPGNPEAIAVSTYIGSQQHIGVAIYDNGTRRPAMADRPYDKSNLLEFSDDPATLYGHARRISPSWISRMAVDASGVSVVDVSPSNLLLPSMNDMEFVDRRLYMTDGSIIDPASWTILGRFPAWGPVRPDTANRRIWFLQWYRDSWFTEQYMLRGFDLGTHGAIGTLHVPGVLGTPTSLLRWGSDGLAFRTSQNQVFVIRTPLVVSDDPLTTIDAPVPHGVLRGLMTMNGWSIDRQTASGTGVDAVGVYLDGGPGVGTHLGTAVYGESRPDVVESYGAQFENSGWRFVWDASSAAPGAHTLHIAAHSTVSDRTVTVSRPVSVAGVIIVQSGGSTGVIESGGFDTYAVTLGSMPSADVSIAIAADPQLSVSPATLQFTPGAWSMPQTVTVAAVDDAVVENSPHSAVITHTVSSSDPTYTGIAAPSVAAEITDNDAPGGVYRPMTPARILDTRLPPGNLRLGPRSALDWRVAPGAGVPGDASAVILNVTVTSGTRASFLTVYPTGRPRPLASNLNWLPGQTVPNLVQVGVGDAGSVTFYNEHGEVDVIADVQGYVVPGESGPSGAFNALPPARILDTRPDSGFPYTWKTLQHGSSFDVQVSGAGGVPASGVAGVVLNVTVTGPSAASYLTIYPAGAAQPFASNLNFTAGQTVPNRVIVPVGHGGQVTIFNAYGEVDVIADVGGWFADGSDLGATGSIFSGLTPARITDTRPAEGQTNAGRTLGAGSVLSVQVAGQGGVPNMSDARRPRAAVLNVTITGPTAASYLTVYPSDLLSPPLASDLNWLPGQTVPNLVVAHVGADGRINVYNAYGSVEVIVDVIGWYH